MRGLLPALAANPSDTPRMLFVQGSDHALALLDQLPERGLAIVGTRRHTPAARARVEPILDALASALPRIIVSGFAEGVDAIAHSAALKRGLPTVAILGTAIGTCYPRAHAERLGRAVLESDGLLISETPVDERIAPWRFLRRNRLIAGLSAATWVVEAGTPSGALNTAQWAIDLGRDLYVSPPGQPERADSDAGNRRLLETSGAIALHHARQLCTTWPELHQGLARRSKRAEPSASSWVSAIPPDGEPLESLLARVPADQLRGALARGELAIVSGRVMKILWKINQVCR